MKKKEIETIKVIHLGQVPEHYTGIVISDVGDKYWYKEGKVHRTDGPAIELINRNKRWIISNEEFFGFQLGDLIDLTVFISKDKGQYDLYWLKFFTETGIKEFPIIPGMEEDKEFWIYFKKIEAMQK